MRTTNPLAGLFAKSPFGALQAHMKVVVECADEVLPLFEAMRAGDRERMLEQKVKIFDLESAADDLADDLRSHLPKTLFMPVDRRDLLDLLNAQDSIADTAQDVAGLIILRQRELPDVLGPGLLAFVRRVLDAVHKAGELIGEMDELLEIGFRGKETELVERIIRDLSSIESETDGMGMELVAQLFENEDEMSPLSVVYLDRMIATVADIADHAEDVGDRLRLLIAR